MSPVSTRPNPPTPPAFRVFEHASRCELQAMLRTVKDAAQLAETHGYNRARDTAGELIADLHDEQRYRRDLAEHEAGS